MNYINLLLLVIFLSLSSHSFAERGDFREGGQEFREGEQNQWRRGGDENALRRYDNPYMNRHNNNEWGSGNVIVNPQGGQGNLYNANPFPDQTQQNQMFQQDVPNPY
jgi:hypothetical protein